MSPIEFSIRVGSGSSAIDQQCVLLALALKAEGRIRSPGVAENTISKTMLLFVINASFICVSFFVLLFPKVPMVCFMFCNKMIMPSGVVYDCLPLDYDISYSNAKISKIERRGEVQFKLPS